MTKPRKSQKRPQKKPRKQGIRYLVAGGSMLALVGFLVDIRTALRPNSPSNVCQEIVQQQAVLPRDKLAQLLAIPERSSRDAVQSVISAPYCRLPEIEVRAGVKAQREAYPLAFDPQTWFVVLYEGNEYAGYSFVFQR